MNAQKISKFEREDKSNGIPLLQHGIFFSFTRIFLYTFRKIPYNFFLCSVRISRIMNAKISKFEREDKSNEIPLLHHALFFFFHDNFPIYIQKDSFHFFSVHCSYFQKNECKKISKFEREDKRNGIPLLHHDFTVSFTRNFI